jgi:hypothetical protein
MNFLSLDGTPMLYFFSFLQPVVLSGNMAGMWICGVGVTRACYTIVASLWSSIVFVIITVLVHWLHHKHSLYITFVVRMVPTLNAFFPYISDLAVFMHRWMVMNVYLFSLALQPSACSGLLVHEVSWSHTTTRHSRKVPLGRVISSSQRPLPDNTQLTQNRHTSMAPLGFEPYAHSRRAATETGGYEC